MREPVEKIQTAAHGYGCFEHCTLLGHSTATSAVASRLLRLGAVALIVGAVLMLCASTAALYLWKNDTKNDDCCQVYNVRYSMKINGEVREGSVEIDSENNLERFKTRSGAEEAEEIHDFQIGITGIRFFGGDKCYIKSQIKASLQHMGAHNKDSPKFDLTDKLMPVQFDEGFLVWIAGDQPLKDTSFLSNEILSLCGQLPIYWLQPTFHKDGERRKRDTQQAKQSFDTEEFVAAVEEKDPVGHTEEDTSRVMEEEEEGAQSSEGSAYNPENPYHRSGAAREEGTMTFDTMLDHRGICCSDCQRSYTQCERICEPLHGYWPWPYNYRGCQVACRVIMPCRWWVARILGVV